VAVLGRHVANTFIFECLLLYNEGGCRGAPRKKEGRKGGIKTNPFLSQPELYRTEKTTRADAGDSFDTQGLEIWEMKSPLCPDWCKYRFSPDHFTS
jgi:hypothetical protein